MADLVPASYRQAGVIKAGSLPDFPPFDILEADHKTKTGVNSEMIAAVSELLGIPFEMVNGDTDGMVPSLASKRYDVYWSTITESPELLSKHVVVDYVYSSTGWVVAGGNPKNITGYSTMCGLRAAMTSSSPHVGWIKKASEECVAAGKPPVDMQLMSASPDTVLSVQSGRSDIAATSAARASYIAGTSQGKLAAVIDTSSAPVTTGLVFAKGNGELAKAIAAALQVLIDNGTYTKILTKYSIPGQALPKTQVRGE